MLVSDVIKSCSHAQVAHAAVFSIGGDFAEHVKCHASARGQSVGDFAAHHVRRFSSHATERDWRLVQASMRGEDLALLAGLQVVVRRMIDDSQAISPPTRRHAEDRGICQAKAAA